MIRRTVSNPGTSLKVGGSVRELLENVDSNAKKVLINKEAVSLNSHRNGHTTTKTDGSSSSAPAAVEFDLILLVRIGLYTGK